MKRQWKGFLTEIEIDWKDHANAPAADVMLPKPETIDSIEEKYRGGEY